MLGALTVSLAAIGVYAIVAYTSAVRAHELAVRVALGAGTGQAVRMIVREAMVPVLVGLGAGVIAALFLARLLTSLLYGVSSQDPATYLGAGLVIAALGAAASALPGWRAATRPPLPLLRGE